MTFLSLLPTRRQTFAYFLASWGNVIMRASRRGLPDVRAAGNAWSAIITTHPSAADACNQCQHRSWLPYSRADTTCGGMSTSDGMALLTPGK